MPHLGGALSTFSQHIVILLTVSFAFNGGLGEGLNVKSLGLIGVYQHMYVSIKKFIKFCTSGGNK